MDSKNINRSSSQMNGLSPS